MKKGIRWRNLEIDSLSMTTIKLNVNAVILYSGYSWWKTSSAMRQGSQPFRTFGSHGIPVGYAPPKAPSCLADFRSSAWDSNVLVSSDPLPPGYELRKLRKTYTETDSFRGRHKSAGSPLSRVSHNIHENILAMLLIIKAGRSTGHNSHLSCITTQSHVNSSPIVHS